MKFFLAALALLSFLVFSHAVSSQTEEIAVSASEVSSLIRVQSGFSFEQLIPGREYSTPVLVEWNIPSVSLKNLVEKKVVLHVKAEPRVENSWVYFKKNGQNTGAVLLQLVCFVENGECAPESVVSQTITAFYRAPSNAAYPHDDGLRVTATLETPKLTDEELRAERQAYEKIVEYEKRIIEISSTPGNPAATVQQLEQLLEQARELLNEKRLAELQKKIAELEMRIGELATPTPIEASASQQAAPAPSAQQPPGGQTGFATASSAAAVGLVVLAVLGYAVWWKLSESKKPYQPEDAGAKSKPVYWEG